MNIPCHLCSFLVPGLTCRRLPLNLRERLVANYNSHLLHARDVDPFKLALIKVIGRIDPQRRNIPLVIASTEDWAWFQLAMVRIKRPMG